MERRSELHDRIERHESMEQKMGIEMRAMSAVLQEEDGDFTLTLNCELYSTSGETLPWDVKIQVVSYDEEGRIICSNSDTVWAEDFAGFAVLSILDFPHKPPVRIRVFPQKA